MKPLVARMEAAKDVRITGPDTDLRFSTAGIPVVSCAGEMNIPDGEVFTAPVRDSVEGFIRFNTPTIYQGASFDGVRLEGTGEEGMPHALGHEIGATVRVPRVVEMGEDDQDTRFSVSARHGPSRCGGRPARRPHASWHPPASDWPR